MRFINTPESDYELARNSLVNPREFRVLYDRYFKLIFKTARAKFEKVDDVQDVLQQTFIKAYSNLDRYNPNQSSFSTWLLKICQNVIIDHFRKNQKHDKRLQLFSEDQRYDDMHSHNVDLDSQISISRSLAKLESSIVAIIRLRFLEDKSIREIATELGCTENAVYKRLRKGLTLLKALLR